MPDGPTVALDDGGFVFSGDAGFVADPADIRATDGDECAGLEFADQGIAGGPIILLPLAVGAFAAGAIEPDLVNRAVVREQLAELVPEVFVVFRRVAIGRLVAVPRREVKTDASLFLAQRLDDLPDDVALAVALALPSHPEQ